MVSSSRWLARTLRRESGAHPPRGLRRRYRCCSNRFGPFALARARIREKLGRYSGHELGLPFSLSVLLASFRLFARSPSSSVAATVASSCFRSAYQHLCLFDFVKFCDSLLFYNRMYDSKMKGKIVTCFRRI